MSTQRRLSEADQHLLDLVRSGDTDGWSQFVQRYQRRLIAFATARAGQHATAEDLVQETFVAFLQSMSTYRADCDLESFLFQILRRRIIDHYRSQGKTKLIPACDLPNYGLHDDSRESSLAVQPSTELTASRHISNQEQLTETDRRLSGAIATLADELRSNEKFRDLKIAEGLFYAGISNKELATLIDVTANEIAVVKHRLIKRVSDLVGKSAPEETFNFQETSLREVWEDHRPSCPKRSTLGQYTLGILPVAWNNFITFHVTTLGCIYCNANLTELSENEPSTQQADHLFRSTIGFLERKS